MVENTLVALEADPLDALNRVNNGDFNRPKGFFPIVLERNSSILLALGRDTEGDFLGMRFIDVLAILSAVEQKGIMQYLEALADQEDSWGEMLWPAFDPTKATQQSDIASIHVVLSRTDSEKRYLVLGLYAQQQLLNDQWCETSRNMPCTIDNVRSFVGAAISRMLPIQQEVELWKLFSDITFAQHYKLNDWYVFVYQFGFGTRGECVAHGLSPVLIGQNVTEVLEARNLDPGVGEELHKRLVASAERGGGWVRYDWDLPGVGMHEKISFTTGIEKFGTFYYLGVGITHRRHLELSDFQCNFCSKQSAYPCVKANTEAVLVHTQVELLASFGQDQLQKITTLPYFRMENQNATGLFDGYFPIVVHHNETIMAFAGKAALVGQPLAAYFEEIVDAKERSQIDAIHSQFIDAATEGGRWVAFSIGAERRAAYVVPIGTEYYGVADHAWPGNALLSSTNCSAAFGGSCSKEMAWSIVGDTVTGINTAESLDDLDVVLDHVNRTSHSGFFGIVLDAETGEIVAHGGEHIVASFSLVSSISRQGAWTERWSESTSTLGGADLERLLEAGTTHGGDWVQVLLEQENENEKVLEKVGFVMTADFRRKNYVPKRYLVVSFFNNKPSPSPCGHCPQNSKCNPETGHCECNMHFQAVFAAIDSSSCTNIQETRMTCTFNLQSELGWNEGIVNVSRTMMMINLAVSVMAIVWTLRYRTHPVVKAAQVPFLLLIVVGCIVSSLTILPLTITDNNLEIADETGGNLAASRACMASVWVYVIGFMMTFAPLFAKMTRVMFVFDVGVSVNHQEKLRSRLSSRTLVWTIVRFLLGDLLVVLVWTLHDPLVYRRTPLAWADDGSVVKSIGACSSSSSTLFLVLIGTYHLGVLFWGSYVCIRCRNIHTAFSESRYVGVAIFSNLQVLLLGIPVLLIAAETPAMSIFIRSGVVFLNDFTVLAVIFFPKVKYVLFGVDGTGVGAEFIVSGETTKSRERKRANYKVDPNSSATLFQTTTVLSESSKSQK